MKNSQAAEDPPYQLSPNGGHLHSDLHRRMRHEGLPPTNKENISNQQRKISLQRRITEKTTMHRNALSVSSLFFKHLCQARGYPVEILSCTFLRPKCDCSNTALQYPLCFSCMKTLTPKRSYVHPLSFHLFSEEGRQHKLRTSYFFVLSSVQQDTG